MASIVGVLGKAAMGILMSLLTETFLKALLVRALKMWAESTESKVDDKMVEDVQKALGVSD